MVIVLVVSCIINVILGFIVYNLFRKIELYETVIQEFYAALSITLHNMRALDERRMFEEDDEVGSVFAELTDIVNELRPLLYGNTNE